MVRDIFNDNFGELIVEGDKVYERIEEYLDTMAPDLKEKLSKWDPSEHQGKDVFDKWQIDAQLRKGMERQVYLPSGGSIVIDRTEAMTTIDVNTGRFIGRGKSLEETVTRCNLEAAEEIARQLRLRDIGGMVMIDFVDMVMPANRDLVLRRLVECLARDRTKHQVAEVTSLGLVQMTRKRIGQGLVEAFSEECPTCHGAGSSCMTSRPSARITTIRMRSRAAIRSSRPTSTAAVRMCRCRRAPRRISRPSSRRSPPRRSPRTAPTRMSDPTR